MVVHFGGDGALVGDEPRQWVVRGSQTGTHPVDKIVRHDELPESTQRLIGGRLHMADAQLEAERTCQLRKGVGHRAAYDAVGVEIADAPDCRRVLIPFRESGHALPTPAPPGDLACACQSVLFVEGLEVFGQRLLVGVDDAAGCCGAHPTSAPGVDGHARDRDSRREAVPAVDRRLRDREACDGGTRGGRSAQLTLQQSPGDTAATVGARHRDRADRPHVDLATRHGQRREPGVDGRHREFTGCGVVHADVPTQAHRLAHLRDDGVSGFLIEESARIGAKKSLSIRIHRHIGDAVVEAAFAETAVRFWVDGNEVLLRCAHRLSLRGSRSRRGSVPTGECARRAWVDLPISRLRPVLLGLSRKGV